SKRGVMLRKVLLASRRSTSISNDAGLHPRAYRRDELVFDGDRAVIGYVEFCGQGAQFVDAFIFQPYFIGRRWLGADGFDFYFAEGLGGAVHGIFFVVEYRVVLRALRAGGAEVAVVVRHRDSLASVVGGRQINVGRTAHHLTMFIEPRAVA